MTKMVMRWLVSALLIGALAGCTSAGKVQPVANQQAAVNGSYKAPQKITFDYDEVDPHGQVSIPVEVSDNGDIHLYAIISDSTRVRFRLDTGATTVTLSQKTRSRLTQADGASAAAIYSCRPESTANMLFSLPEPDETVESKECLLDQLQIGPIKFSKVRSRYIVGGESDLLGMSFLAELGEFTIDIPNSVLIARPSDTYRLIPRASFFPTEDQQIVAAMQHWDTLAQMEVARIVEALQDDLRPLWIPANMEIVSPFAGAYADLLTKYFIQNGKTVLAIQSEEDDALEIHYKILVVEHENPDKEALITTSVINGSRVLFSDSRVYYLSKNDHKNYISARRTEVVNFKVKGCDDQDSCS